MTIQFRQAAKNIGNYAIVLIVAIAAANSASGATKAPTLKFTANPTTITIGSSTILSWSTTNATSCTASGAWSGSRNTSNTGRSESPTVTSTYTLSCTGAGGTITKSVTVTVTSATTALDCSKVNGPLTNQGTYVINVQGYTWSDVDSAIGCANTALGTAQSGNNVTVIIQLPAGVIDLSQTYTDGSGQAINASIDVSGINCVNPSASNCGIPAGATANTTNHLVIQGAATHDTQIIFTWNQATSSDPMAHSKDIIGIKGTNSVNVAFADITFTYPAMMVTQGTVVSSNTNSVTIDVPAGFPTPLQLLDPAHISGGGGMFLRVFKYDTSTNPVSCTIVQDPLNSDGSINYSQIPIGTSTTYPMGISQVSGAPNRWNIPFASTQSNAPYQAGQILGVKIKSGVNSYDFSNGAYITFDNVTLLRRTRGVFRGNTNNVTWNNSKILPEAAINGISPCMSSGGGGPQMGGQLGIPSSGHIFTNNTFLKVGDDPIAFFDVTNSTATGNTIVGSYSGRGIMVDFTTSPSTLAIDGGGGLNLCSPKNDLVLDYLYQMVGKSTVVSSANCP